MWGCLLFRLRRVGEGAVIVRNGTARGLIIERGFLSFESWTACLM